MTLQPVVAAAIVDSLEYPTRLLAAQRSYPAELDGFYELPGGKVEVGEDALHALHREIEEELGTTLVVGSPVPNPVPQMQTAHEGGLSLDVSDAGFSPWPILQGRVMWVWLAEIEPGAPEPKASGSHRELRWEPLDTVLQLPWLPTNHPIVANTLEGIR